MPIVRHAPQIYHYDYQDRGTPKEEHEVVEKLHKHKLFGDDHHDRAIDSNKDVFVVTDNNNDYSEDEVCKHSKATVFIDADNEIEEFVKNAKIHYDGCNRYIGTSHKITNDNLVLNCKNSTARKQKINQDKNHGNTSLSEEKVTKDRIEDLPEKYVKNIHSIKNKNINKHIIGNNKRNRSKWKIRTRMLVTLLILNLTGQSIAVEVISSSTLASLLGYPSTCTLGVEVRPCTLSLTCWLRGGTRLRGCGGWLFSCCQPPSWDTKDNSIPSSDWSYKVSPPRLRQVPQRNVMPNNVFRRRVDDDVTQFDCGVPSSRLLQKRIIGGREARFAEFPWQAHVRISEFQCGGVLVSRWYVATAAHCVSRAHIRDISVWLGALDTSAGSQTARKVGVIQKILHPLFQFRMTQPDRYDIALLKLSRPITFTRHIRAICLPESEIELWGRMAVIAGWGKTDATDTHTGTNMLRSATVPILSKEQCIAWHQSKQILVEIHSEMLCAGHSDGHQDACLGDSGGPLIVLENGRYYLVGITSAGFGCGVDHQPGIYHNVQVTANWIRALISPNSNFNDV